MHYLALWRMQLASRLLLEGGQVAEVATAVGYESEAAFSRAFKKLVGQAPATWRKRRPGPVGRIFHSGEKRTLRQDRRRTSCRQ
jgi:AraC-like DNA-binding protein